MMVNQLRAQLDNPALSGAFVPGEAKESPLIVARIISTLWTVIMSLGALAVVLFLAMGAIKWITSNGDKGKVEAARDQIMAAIMGMAILFGMFALVNFIFPAIGFNILNPVIQSNLETPGGGSGGTGTGPGKI